MIILTKSKLIENAVSASINNIIGLEYDKTSISVYNDVVRETILYTDDIVDIVSNNEKTLRRKYDR